MRAGLFAATLTPVTAAWEPDAARAVPYYADLLARGCDGLNILGTTGEAMSFSVEQRLAFMQAVAAELPVDRLACGTGAASLADAVTLTRAAIELGFSAALVMPPFFYRDANDDGILAFYEALVERVPAPRILLYHFPRMSGIAFGPALVDRLIGALGAAIAGMKESANDRALEREILAAHPELRLYPGSEEALTEALDFGAAGCISGSVALWPELAARVVRTRDPDAAAELTAKRRELAGRPFIAEVRRRTAEATRDPQWRRSMPPLETAR